MKHTQNSTIAGNAANGFGGGIYNMDEFTMQNSTVANNTSGKGGGICSTGSTMITLTNSTLAGNSAATGSGIVSSNDLALYNMVIANSGSGADCAVDASYIITNVNNLVADGTCSDKGVNFLSGDPRLGALADNGGPTLTCALQPGSPAIDQANAAHAPALDQRGAAQYNAADRGACETTSEIAMLTLAASPAGEPGQRAIFTATVKSFGGIPTGAVQFFVNGVPTGAPTLLAGGSATYSTTALTLGVHTLHATYSGDYPPTASTPLRYAVCNRAIAVQNGNDSGAGSLRQAILDLCPGGKITFNTTSDIVLNSKLLINQSMTIEGIGYDGSLHSRFYTSTHRIFNIAAGAAVTLSHLSLTNPTNSTVNDYGGGIQNAGTLTLEACTLTDLRAKGHGGGIYNTGVLHVQSSVIASNVAMCDPYNDWLNCWGGGIYNGGGAVTVQASTLSDNEAGGAGGGIFNTGGMLTVQSSRINNNVAILWNGGGIYNAGTLLLNESAVFSNFVYYNPWSEPDTPSHGGGIYNTGTGTLTARNSTFVGNGARHSESHGGAIANLQGGHVSLTHCTLTGNTSGTGRGGGIYNIDSQGARLSFYNTIIAANGDGGDCVMETGANLDASVNNLVGDGSCGATFSGDPLLGGLSDNGGATPTCALDPSSLAIDQAHPDYALAWDQREFPRPAGAADLGAFEVVSYTVTTLTAPPAYPTSVGQRVTFTATVRSNIPGTPTGTVQFFVNGAAAGAPALAGGSATFSTTALVAGVNVISATYPGAGDYPASDSNVVYQAICTGDAAIVTSSADSGPGSLRAALASIGSCPNSVISFNQDMTISLSSQLDIAKHVVIDGSGHAITLSGDTNNDSVPDVRVLAIAKDTVVTLSHLTIHKGRSAVIPEDEFGVSNTWGGGGIYNRGQLTVDTCTIADCLVQDEIDSPFRVYGAGIFNGPYGALLLVNSTLAGNVISNTSSSQLAKAAGGGIFNYGALLTVQSSTFFSNSVAPSIGSGGAINSETIMTVQNSTFSGNSAAKGGGMSLSTAWDEAIVTVQNSTLSDNSSGIYIYGDGQRVTLSNSIVAANSNDNFEKSQLAIFTPQGYNLSDDWNGLSIQPTDLTADPLLGPLADNGGDTWTHALLPGSPAIDAGDPATCLATDQRGEPRGDLRCDIGAFELQHAESDTVVKSGMTSGAQASFGPTFISVTVTGGDAGTITVTKHLTTPGGLYNTGELTATWWITASSSPFTVTLALCYTDADIAGINDEASLRAFRWNGTQWTTPISTGLTVDEAANCVRLTGISTFSAWTLKDTSIGAETPTVITLRNLVTRSSLWVAGLLIVMIAFYGLRRKQPLVSQASPRKELQMEVQAGIYTAPEIVCEGNLEIQAGSPLSIPSDFEDFEDLDW